MCTFGGCLWDYTVASPIPVTTENRLINTPTSALVNLLWIICWLKANTGISLTSNYCVLLLWTYNALTSQDSDLLECTWLLGSMHIYYAREWDSSSLALTNLKEDILNEMYSNILTFCFTSLTEQKLFLTVIIQCWNPAASAVEEQVEKTQCLHFVQRVIRWLRNSSTVSCDSPRV